jgi:type VI secretion system secreted protein Hcp
MADQIAILQIKDIKGNCTINGHVGEVIVSSFQHGVAMPMQNDAANTERTAGRARFSEMMFSKMTDQSTPALFQACAAGTKLGDAVLHIGRTENGNFMSLMKYTMTNSMVAQINTSGGGGVPSDSFTLNFTQIKSEFTQQNADSTKKGTAAFGWNLETNQAAAA